MRPLRILVAPLLCLPALGLFAQDRPPVAPRPFLQHMEREGSRVLFFTNRGIAGQFHVDYGRPVWREEYLQQIDSIPAGQRLRLGKDFWTTLETNVPLTIGGVRLEPDQYYLASERTADGFAIVAYEAAPLRRRRVASFQPPAEGGHVIPLTLSQDEDLEEELSIEFVVENRTGKITLELAWGPLRLTAPVEVELPSE